jgi:DNA-directed RNA polymerase specialized sigma24 family protein
MSQSSGSARGVIRQIDRELERVDQRLSGYEPLLEERQRLLAARAALTGEQDPPRRRASQDAVAAYLAEHPDSRPGEIAAALGVPATNVSAHLYRAKHTRFERGGRGWRLRLGGGSDAG